MPPNGIMESLKSSKLLIPTRANIVSNEFTHFKKLAQVNRLFLRSLRLEADLEVRPNHRAFVFFPVPNNCGIFSRKARKGLVVREDDQILPTPGEGLKKENGRPVNFL